jgi:Concanavalin A-like lectin/glucanases superfamily
MTSRSLVIALLTLLFAAPAAHAQSNGLVAAYGFEESSGSSAVDGSGAGNTGTLAGSTRSASGRFGAALEFDGIDDRVNVADSASLDLSTGMTLEAWVRPDAFNWRTVVLKERPGGLAYALYGSSDNNRPMAEIAGTASGDTRGPGSLPTGTWSHLATTFDGATLRLYVNGTQVSSRAMSGAIALSSGALRIGGNAVWGEYFDGLIDEVRIYNRALTAGEIQLDMGRAVVSADGEPPSAPADLAATVTGDDVHLSWTESTDPSGVREYRIFRNGTLHATVPAA